MDVSRFHHHLERQMPGLSADELAELTAAFTLRQVKKREFIVQPGRVADFRVYVLQGAFRAYVIDPAGGEHTIKDRLNRYKNDVGFTSYMAATANRDWRR